jgi:Protein of unknown function (DUF2752)
MGRTDKLISAAAGGILLLSALVPAGAIPNLLPCPFKLLTGWPCPGCGLTHAICDISHGRFAMAWAANPFGYLFYAALVVCLLWPCLQMWFASLGTLLRSSRTWACSHCVSVIGPIERKRPTVSARPLDFTSTLCRRITLCRGFVPRKSRHALPAGKSCLRVHDGYRFSVARRHRP